MKALGWAAILLTLAGCASSTSLVGSEAISASGGDVQCGSRNPCPVEVRVPDWYGTTACYYSSQSISIDVGTNPNIEWTLTAQNPADQAKVVFAGTDGSLGVAVSDYTRASSDQHRVNLKPTLNPMPPLDRPITFNIKRDKTFCTPNNPLAPNPYVKNRGA